MATVSTIQDLELVEENRQNHSTTTTAQENPASVENRQLNERAFNYNAPIRTTQGSPALVAIIISIIFLATGNFVRCSSDKDTPTEGIFKQYDGLGGKTGPTRELAQAAAISAACFGFLGLAASYIKSQSKTSTIESASYLVAFIMQVLSFTFVINHPFCDGKNDCQMDNWDYNPEYSPYTYPFEGQSCTISWGLPFAASLLFALSALAAAW